MQLATSIYFFVEYVTEDCRKKLKNVGGIPHVCMLSYLITVQLFVCIYGDCHVTEACRNFSLRTRHNWAHQVSRGTIAATVTYRTCH